MQQDIINNMVMVDFYICANKLDFEKIDSVMNVSSSKRRKRDNFIIGFYAKDYWSIDTEYMISNDINNQIKVIIEKIGNKTDIINKILYDYKAQCGFVVCIKNFNEPLPAMYFEEDFVKFAANINANIGFDFT